MQYVCSSGTEYSRRCALLFVPSIKSLTWIIVAFFCRQSARPLLSLHVQVCGPTFQTSCAGRVVLHWPLPWSIYVIVSHFIIANFVKYLSSSSLKPDLGHPGSYGVHGGCFDEEELCHARTTVLVRSGTAVPIVRFALCCQMLRKGGSGCELLS